MYFTVFFLSLNSPDVLALIGAVNYDRPADFSTLMAQNIVVSTDWRRTTDDWYPDYTDNYTIIRHFVLVHTNKSKMSIHSCFSSTTEYLHSPFWRMP